MPALRLLHLTDPHILARPDQTLYGVDTYARVMALLEHVRRTMGKPDLALLTGDCVETPSPAAYARLKTLLAEHLDAPCLMLAGNHDDPALLATMFPEALAPLATRSGWLFVLLDSTQRGSPAGALAESELARLDAALSAYPDHHALIALHHPPLPVGSVWMDKMILAADSAARLFEILRRHGNVRLLLCGHAHQEREWTIDGLRLFLTPSAAFQFQPGCAAFTLDDSPPACRWLELGADGASAGRVIRISGLRKQAPSV